MEGMTMMAKAADAAVETSIFADRDRIVRTLDEYPELKKALHAGDVPTGRYLCAQLFKCDPRPAAPMAMSAKAS